MKIKTKSQNKTLVLTVATIVLIFSAAALFYLVNINGSQNNNDQDTTPDRSESDIRQAEEIAREPSKKETQTNTDTPLPPTVDETSGKTILSMASSYDISDKTLYIRGGISNSVESEGTCFAELTAPNGEVIKKETSLLPNATTTDCKTISIPLSELSTGHWKFTLNYISNTKVGKSNEASFNI